VTEREREQAARKETFPGSTQSHTVSQFHTIVRKSCTVIWNTVQYIVHTVVLASVQFSYSHTTGRTLPAGCSTQFEVFFGIHAVLFFGQLVEVSL
jgi:hypothetical protein